MKKVLFATTAAGALAVAGMASAQGITLFGDARLGLGYQIDNDGDFQGTEDDVRAISRVRFGVRMTGETTSGITFGATIRADNAIGGEGGLVDADVIESAPGVFEDIFPVSNQVAGSVFVSGSYGTLTFGDTDEAHQQHVGDLPELGLTGLTFANEVPYLGNRVFGNDYRPTVRYDYDIAGFGVSLSTGNELDSIGLGASYTFDFGGGSVTAGGGYFDGSANDFLDEALGDEVEDDASQWAAGLSGEFAGFTGQVIYSAADLDTGDVDTLGFGLGTTFGAIGINAIYVKVLEAPGEADGDDAYGADFTYDLGGGAELKGGVVSTFVTGDFEDGGTVIEGDNEIVADFGISMAF